MLDFVFIFTPRPACIDAACLENTLLGLLTCSQGLTAAHYALGRDVARLEKDVRAQSHEDSPVSRLGIYPQPGLIGEGRSRDIISSSGSDVGRMLEVEG